MNNPTQLLPTSLIAVEVPKDAKEFKICSVCKEYKSFDHFGFRGKESKILKSGCKKCYSLKNSCDKSKTIIKDLEGEIWKDIELYEGIYQVSNLGRIKSLDRYVDRLDEKIGYRKSKLLKQPLNHRGYKMVTLNKKGIAKAMLAHRIVAKAFIVNSKNKPQVNHINGIKSDNTVANLEWCTGLENVIHYWSAKKPKTKQ